MGIIFPCCFFISCSSQLFILSIMKPTEINTTLWDASAKAPHFDKLSKNIDTEVLIIGGGISGITTAYSLLKAGKQVTLIEQTGLGRGQTARTTAHLTYCLDIRYSQLKQRIGNKNTIAVANSHMAALEWMDRTVRLEKINCNFKRINGYLFSAKAHIIQQEYQAIQDLGLIADFSNQVPGIKSQKQVSCIYFAEQAQVHVMDYINGLTKAIVKMGARIYVDTSASQINENNVIANNFNINAEHIVITANTALNTSELDNNMQKFQSYVIAIKIPKGTLPYSLWWEIEQPDSEDEIMSYHYARLEGHDDLNDMFIVGGEDKKISEPDSDVSRYNKLQEWAEKRFALTGSPEYKWSGIISYTNDRLPFLGRYRYNNHYIITADSGNGINYAIIGSKIITDSICEKKNDWETLFTPLRIQPGLIT